LPGFEEEEASTDHNIVEDEDAEAEAGDRAGNVCPVRDHITVVGEESPVDGAAKVEAYKNDQNCETDPSEGHLRPVLKPLF
jgi:hypothetical protein